MSQFGLGVTAVDLIVLGQGHPLFQLLVVREGLQTLYEHRVAQSVWRLVNTSRTTYLSLQQPQIREVSRRLELPVEPLSVHFGQSLCSLVHQLHLLFTGHVEPFMARRKQGICCEKLLQLLYSFHLRFSSHQKRFKFFSVEASLFPLCLQVRVYF